MDGPFTGWIRYTPEYRMIASVYGDRTAERSGLPLINHIHDGLDVISALGMDMEAGAPVPEFNVPRAMQAYCLHPLLQNDKELLVNHTSMHMVEGLTMLCAMEYRYRANAWLSDKVLDFDGIPHSNTMPTAGDIPEVWAMLMADKLQNVTDFAVYHMHSHPRALHLIYYFASWLGTLLPSEKQEQCKNFMALATQWGERNDKILAQRATSAAAT